MDSESKIAALDKASGIKVTVTGAIVNIILAVLKFIFGYLGNSRALVADAVHSVSDLISDLVVFLGLHFGSMPADRDHHYGHKKIENFTEIILGLILIGVALKLAYDSGVAIWLKQYSLPKPVTIIAALISILAKELLYRWTKHIANQADNRALLANAWHHRSDALSSIAVLVGLVAVQISPQLAFMDAAASLVVSALIIKVGWQILQEAFIRIIDTAPPPDYVDKIYKLISEYPKITNPHKLRMRYVGNQIHMEVHIEVAPEMTVKEGHDIAAGVKHKILNYDKRVMDVTVHIEPEGEGKKPH